MILAGHVLPNQGALSETRLVFLTKTRGSFPAQKERACCELRVLWLRSMLEPLNLAIVTPHTAHPPTHPPTQRERESYRAVLVLTQQKSLTPLHFQVELHKTEGTHSKIMILALSHHQ